MKLSGHVQVVRGSMWLVSQYQIDTMPVYVRILLYTRNRIHFTTLVVSAGYVYDVTSTNYATKLTITQKCFACAPSLTNPGNSNLLAHFGRTTRTLFTSERSHGQEGQGAGVESYTCANSEQPTNPFRVNDDGPSIWAERIKIKEGNRCGNQIIAESSSSLHSREKCL